MKRWMLGALAISCIAVQAAFALPRTVRTTYLDPCDTLTNPYASYTNLAPVPSIAAQFPALAGVPLPDDTALALPQAGASAGKAVYQVRGAELVTLDFYTVSGTFGSDFSGMVFLGYAAPEQTSGPVYPAFLEPDGGVYLYREQKLLRLQAGDFGLTFVPDTRPPKGGKPLGANVYAAAENGPYALLTAERSSIQPVCGSDGIALYRETRTYRVPSGSTEILIEADYFNPAQFHQAPLRLPVLLASVQIEGNLYWGGESSSSSSGPSSSSSQPSSSLPPSSSGDTGTLPPPDHSGDTNTPPASSGSSESSKPEQSSSKSEKPASSSSSRPTSKPAPSKSESSKASASSAEPERAPESSRQEQPLSPDAAVITAPEQNRSLLLYTLLGVYAGCCAAAGLYLWRKRPPKD